MSARRRAFAFVTALASLSFAGALGATACSNINPAGLPEPDAGQQASVLSPPIVGDAGTVQSFPLGGPGDPGGGGIYVTVSGESNALTGYPFPPESFADDTYMVDGWEFVIDEYLVSLDKVTLWSDPNLSPSNQLEHGQQVAHLDGPFIVDLHKGGHLIGQGGSPEEATPLGVITSQNDNGGQAFDSTTTYGFGFSTVPAAYAGYNVNLDATELADFQYMVDNDYSVLYVGHATWKGNDPSNPYPCTQTNAGPGPGPGPDAGVVSSSTDGGEASDTATYVDGGYDFSKLPTTMNFRLGFSTPTNYVNCQNMTLTGAPDPGEDYPRGIQVSPSQSVFAQVTIHMDHPFWESFAEDTPVHWDQIAARYANASGVPVVHTEDLVGVPFDGFVDSTGTPVPWRNCSGSNYTPPGNGQMVFDTLNVAHDPTGICVGPLGQDSAQDECPGIRDYYDFIRYTQSTQGHLNSQGLCYIDRRYPAPAGGS